MSIPPNNFSFENKVSSEAPLTIIITPPERKANEKTESLSVSIEEVVFMKASAIFRVLKDEEMAKKAFSCICHKEVKIFAAFLKESIDLYHPIHESNIQSLKINTKTKELFKSIADEIFCLQTKLKSSQHHSPLSKRNRKRHYISI